MAVAVPIGVAAGIADLDVSVLTDSEAEQWYNSPVNSGETGNGYESAKVQSPTDYILNETSEVSGPGYLDLDGTRYMTIPHASEFDIAAGGQMTVSLKVWLDSYGAHRGIIANRWHSGTSNASTTGFEIFGGNSATQSMSNNVNLNRGSWNNLGHPYCNTLSTGVWSVITWVFDGNSGTSKMYLDGVLKSTRSAASYPINPQCDVLVGARYDISDGSEATVNTEGLWLGKIDDVRFYSRALTDDEVVADMSATVDSSTPDLIAAYDFSMLSGTNCPDISGNGHDGVLVGFPDYSASGSLLTIEAPEAGTGTITVSDGATQLNNGSRVEDGTILTVEATPAADYVLDAIYVNGSAITGNTFTMNGATTVSATFTRDPSAPTKVLVFDMNEDGSKYYRIPAIATAADGSLVALADKRGNSLGDLPNTISIVAKRSTDGGETWSSAVTIAEGNSSLGKTYGDPAVVLDRNSGKLIAVFSGDTGFFVSTKTSRAGFYVSTSSDNGQTWTEPRAITDQLYQSSWYGAFCASGSMLQTESGRIMFVANARLSSAQYLTDVYEYVCASDDGGETWTVLNKDSRIPSDGQGNESKLVELSDGSLIMSIRSGSYRRFSRSTDGGVTWTAATAVNDLPDPSCNGDIITYPSADGQARLLHTLPANSSVRRDVSVFMSYDDGQTWPVSKKLIDGYSAYSSLTVLPDGSIGCFVEEGKWDSNIPGEDGFRLYFMKFTLDWLTDGSDDGGDDPVTDVYDGTLNLDGTRYMIIPNSEEFNIAAGGKLTVSLKAKISSNAMQTFISNRVRRYENSNNNDVSGWAIYNVPGTTSTSFNYPGSSWTARHHDSSGISTGEWHHLCWVYSGSSSAFYVDGVAVSNPPAVNNSPIPSYCDILVGAGYTMTDHTKFSIENLNNFVNGNIDDVRIYGDALSSSEVAQDKEATAPLSDKNIIAAYDFAEIKGIHVTDISGNGHTGELVNFPTAAETYLLTIETPESTKGTLKVYNGEAEVYSGRQIEAGSVLRVEAEGVSPYVVKAVYVNGVALEDGTDTFTMSEAATVSAEFEIDPTLPVSYASPSGDGLSDTNCYVELATTTGALKDISIARSSKNGTNYELCEDQSIVVAPGQSFTLNLQAKKTNSITTSAPSPQDLRYCVAYIFADWDGDGVFDIQMPTDSEFADSYYYGYSSKASTSLFNNVKANYDHTLDITHTFQVPEDAALKQTRIRVIYTEAWDPNIVSGTSPALISGNYQSINKGYAYDYIVVCQKSVLEAPRTVTVVSENDALGTVAITTPETEGNSVTTDETRVVVTATPGEGISFLNWTNSANEVISTENPYTYTGEDDETLTAHFGYTVSYTAGASGNVTVTADGVGINSGDVVAPGTEVVITATPDDGKTPIVEINGGAVDLTDNTYTFNVEAATMINVTFVDQINHLTIVSEGNGSVQVWTGYDFDNPNAPAGVRIADGGIIPTYSDDLEDNMRSLECYLIPGSGTEGYESVETINYSINGVVTNVALDGNAILNMDPSLEIPADFNEATIIFEIPLADVNGEVVINVTFSDSTQGIGEIGIDEADGPVEFYNLQGVRVAAENIVAGFYIVRQGNTVRKVFVRK